MSIALILDCGATNVRAIAVESSGHIVASHHISNETVQTGNEHVWNFDDIWNKLVQCVGNVTAQLPDMKRTDISAIAVTTFGVDGAPFNKDGQQIYPIISWKCSRTIAVMAQVEAEMDRQKLYLENGVGDYSFNTLYKLRWLKEHEPEVYQQMDKFVFISSMINHRLTGKLTTDRTMAGTSMLTNLQTGEWNKEALDYLGLTEDHFPPMVDAGEVIGTVSHEMAKLFDVPDSTAVISAGHDTQFALFGSGVEENQPFLSSGTWEILMARANNMTLNPSYLADGLTTELDAKRGLYNPAVQWLSSAVMEWVSSTYFPDLQQQPNKYSQMIKEGSAVPAGCNGVKFIPSFQPKKDDVTGGHISGLSINTTRGEIYRSALEGLASKLKESLATLSEVGKFQVDSLVVVGGGSRNSLWNQIRADVLEVPILVVDEPECTVMGAAMYALAGAGVYKSADEAQKAMKPSFTTVTPRQG